jgi:hypothetical protein
LEKHRLAVLFYFSDTRLKAIKMPIFYGLDLPGYI